MTGCDRPALKLLNKHVRKHISSKWHDLGLELLEQEDEETLNEIEINHPNDASKCCKQMFQLWLSKCPTATWNQLIQALREVDLNNLAITIEGMLIKTVNTGMLCRCNYVVMYRHQCWNRVFITDQDNPLAHGSDPFLTH